MIISIITVCKNCKDDLKCTINSIIPQKNGRDDIEYIIVDGDSTDGTVDIIRENNRYISKWVSEPDKGIYDAMNKGIKIASGKYVIFMNAGDYFEERALANIIECLKDNDVDILYGKVNLIIDNKPWGIIGITEESKIKDIYLKNVFCHQGMVIKRTLFDELGYFDTGYHVLADYDWNLKAYVNGKKISMIKKTISNFCYGGTCTSSRKADEYLSIVSKYTLDTDERKTVINKIYKDYCEWDRYKSSLKILQAKEGNGFGISPISGMKDKYIIWGAGVNGEESFFCLQKMSKEIVGFIDADKRKNHFHGLNVCRKEQADLNSLPENIGICISSTEYESEIKKELLQYSISSDKIITFREIRNWIGNLQ